MAKATDIMMEITSTNNDLVKDTVRLHQRKYRDETGKFLLEGYKCIEEAHQAGVEIEMVFVLSEKSSDYAFIKDKVILTNEAVLKKISTTDSAPDAVAVGIQKHYEKSVLTSTKKVILLENIKDLGNLGTILRTAVAFGMDAVVLYGESVDVYNPKSVRSSVGNLWKIPVLKIKDFVELKSIFGDFERIATSPRAKTLLGEFTPKQPYLVMFGSEADGLSEDLMNFATQEVKIEISDKVESLNLSVSCGIVLYKLKMEN